MKNILLSISIVAFALCFASCAKYDSYEDMKIRSAGLDGVFGFKIGEGKDKVMRSIDDHDFKVKVGVPYGIFTYSDYSYMDDECKGKIEWFNVSGVSSDSIRTSEEIALTFYNGKLALIEARVGNRRIGENLNGEYLTVSDNVTKAIEIKYGKGASMMDKNAKKEIPTRYRRYIDNRYSNGDVVRYYEGENVFLATQYHDWSDADILPSKEKTMYVLCGDMESDIFDHILLRDKTYYIGSRPHIGDEEYNKSLSRQRSLEEAGMEDAAKMERNARLRYLEGGGYHSKDGSGQVHFQGSREQEEQLRQMEEMGW